MTLYLHKYNSGPLGTNVQWVVSPLEDWNVWDPKRDKCFRIKRKALKWAEKNDINLERVA